MTLLAHFADSSATAARNMALDATLLGTGKLWDLVCWRFYGWTEPAITFGYSQSWEWVKEQTVDFAGCRVRRMTGGGIVDHRSDLTYALTIPPAHPVYREQARNIYSALHAGLTGILKSKGIAADLAPCPGPCGTASTQRSGICFQSPEPFDIVDTGSGLKIAGAAMKRNKDGVLIQGSLSPGSAGFPSREIMEAEFGHFLKGWLGASPSPDKRHLPEELVKQEEQRFNSPQWNLRR